MPESPYGTPILVSADKSITRLSSVGLTTSTGEDFGEEKWLQRLAFDHPECLPIAAIDSSYTTVLPLCLELRTGAGYVDALYVTADGRLLLLEAKLWRNPDARRKVVAQILDYAKELARWSYDDLQREVARASKTPEESLFLRVKAAFPEVDEATFVDQATRNLREGRFMLLIVGDGIREGAGAITDFLRTFASLDFSFGLVELALYRAPAGGLVVLPRVAAKTVTMQRTVVTVRDATFAPEDAEPGQPGKPELTELQRFYESFWSEFIPTLRLDDKTQTLPNVTRKGNAFLPMPPSGSEAWITVYFEQSSREAGLFLTFARGSFADIAYARLVEDREAIDKALDMTVVWSTAEGKHTILSKRTFSDLRSPEQRGPIMSFLRDAINRYVNVFRPRLARIAGGDLEFASLIRGCVRPSVGRDRCDVSLLEFHQYQAEGILIREGLARIATEYLSAKREELKNHPLARFIRTEFPDSLAELLSAVGPQLQVEGTKFMGNWARTPPRSSLPSFNPILRAGRRSSRKADLRSTRHAWISISADAWR